MGIVRLGITRAGLPQTGDGVFDFAKHQVAQAKGGLVHGRTGSRGASRKLLSSQGIASSGSPRRTKVIPSWLIAWPKFGDIPMAISSSSLESLTEPGSGEAFPCMRELGQCRYHLEGLREAVVRRALYLLRSIPAIEDVADQHVGNAHPGAGGAWVAVQRPFKTI